MGDVLSGEFTKQLAYITQFAPSKQTINADRFLVCRRLLFDKLEFVR